MGTLREQWLLLISTPVYVITIGVEILLSHLQHRKAYTVRDTLSNVYLMLLNGGIDLAFRVVYVAVLQYFFTHAIYTWHYAIAYWFFLLVAEDFTYYWLHRFDHQIRLFWAVHVTHHSSQQLNFSVGFRSSVFQPLYRFVYFIPLAWLGCKPIDIMFIYAATQIWGIFVHTELIRHMGWLEYLLVTPSHHRVHHASNPKYLDKNMGMFLIVWDKWFGTFQPELPAEVYQPIQYGLTKNNEKQNAVTIVFHEWKAILQDIGRNGLTFKERMGYIWGKPGWSHDGSRMTSEEMRRAESDSLSHDATVEEKQIVSV